MKMHALLIGFLLTAATATAQDLELKKGDHICIIGNTLAERMQHFGWLETLIHARFPQHELVFVDGSQVDVQVEHGQVKHQGLALGLPRVDPQIVARLTAAGAPAPQHPEHNHATAGNAS